jgi:hypothetical protein
MLVNWVEYMYAAAVTTTLKSSPDCPYVKAFTLPEIVSSKAEYDEEVLTVSIAWNLTVSPRTNNDASSLGSAPFTVITAASNPNSTQGAVVHDVEGASNHVPLLSATVVAMLFTSDGTPVGVPL